MPAEVLVAVAPAVVCAVLYVAVHVWRSRR
jgi:hypothetical protein